MTIDLETVNRRRAKLNAFFERARKQSVETGRTPSLRRMIHATANMKDDPDHRLFYFAGDRIVHGMSSAKPVDPPLIHVLKMLQSGTPETRRWLSLFSYRIIVNATPSDSFKDHRFVKHVHTALLSIVGASDALYYAIAERMGSQLILAGIPRTYNADGAPVTGPWVDMLIDAVFLHPRLTSEAEGEVTRSLRLVLETIIKANIHGSDWEYIAHRILYAMAGGRSRGGGLFRIFMNRANAPADFHAASILEYLINYNSESVYFDARGGSHRPRPSIQGPLEISRGVPLLALAVMTFDVEIVNLVYYALSEEEREARFSDELVDSGVMEEDQSVLEWITASMAPYVKTPAAAARMESHERYQKIKGIITGGYVTGAMGKR